MPATRQRLPRKVEAETVARHVDWTGGLSSEEAARRLNQYGANATVDVEPPAWRVLFGKFIAPVPCLLKAAIVL
jgi:hypothetical protein